MKRNTPWRASVGLLCAGLGALLCTQLVAGTAAAETLYGVKVYSKSQTPTRVTQHRAYPLKQGGDTWFFDQTKRRAMHDTFVNYCQSNLSGYVGKRIDCANLALDNLLNFAKDQGLRMTFKVYTRNGARYVDSARFNSFDQLKSWTQRFLGAHNVTDNCKLVKPLAGMNSPEAWSCVKSGDLLMWAYYKPGADPTKPGRMTTVGHTQPIVGVQRGATLDSTYLKTINGDIQLSTGEQLPAYTTNKYVRSIHPVEGGHSLSNYPQNNGQLFKVLQHFDRSRPIGDGAPPQPTQGPVRWGIFM